MRLVHLVLLSVVLPLLFNSVVTGQKRTREEMVKEAGRIVTEAERKFGEAHKKVKQGGERKLIVEAERGFHDRTSWKADGTDWVVR